MLHDCFSECLFYHQIGAPPHPCQKKAPSILFRQFPFVNPERRAESILKSLLIQVHLEIPRKIASGFQLSLIITSESVRNLKCNTSAVLRHPQPPSVRNQTLPMLLLPILKPEQYIRKEEAHINLRCLLGTLAGWFGDTQRDKQGSPGQCARHVLLFTSKELTENNIFEGAVRKCYVFLLCAFLLGVAVSNRFLDSEPCTRLEWH